MINLFLHKIIRRGVINFALILRFAFILILSRQTFSTNSVSRIAIINFLNESNYHILIRQFRKWLKYRESESGLRRKIIHRTNSKAKTHEIYNMNIAHLLKFVKQKIGNLYFFITNDLFTRHLV